MRTVDLKWQNLAAGLKRAEKLETELRGRWASRIEEARKSRFEGARAAWKGRQDAKRRQFEKDLAEWRARQDDRARELEGERGAWERALSEERQRLTVLARRGALAGLPVIVVVAAVLALLGAPVSWFVIAAAAVFVVALGPALLSWRRVTDLRWKDPTFRRSEDPEPQFAPDQPEPKAGRRNPVALDIGRQWWREVAYDPSAHAARSKPTHGDKGVEDFASGLMARLSDKYVALREVQVAKALDVDLLVLGPTGLWILESKYWSGEIFCRQGKWSQRRTWHEQGGYEASKEKPVDNPDAQWLREEQAVKKTLERRLPQPGKLISAIRGGIVFTHPDIDWSIDRSCKSVYGNVEYWVEAIGSGPGVLKLTPEEQLRVLDALLTWAHSLDEDLRRMTSCSVKRAEGLFSKATAKARTHVGAAS